MNNGNRKKKKRSNNYNNTLLFSRLQITLRQIIFYSWILNHVCSNYNAYRSARRSLSVTWSVTHRRLESVTWRNRYHLAGGGFFYDHSWKNPHRRRGKTFLKRRLGEMASNATSRLGSPWESSSFDDRSFPDSSTGKWFSLETRGERFAVSRD